ncbi:MAG: hypothetical protein J5855_04105 [Mailhella sp.]|nr:hypothetical protein [Mailhella sp.]
MKTDAKTDVQTERGKRLKAWLKLAAYGFAAWLILCQGIPWIYRTVPTLSHEREVLDKYDIAAGAIYYTDVPITFESEMKTRESVRKAMVEIKTRRRAEKEKAGD